ncbi:MAG: hypothetical protein EXS37_07900 [Opitutus sp.]|nr:hypothetical protein [Opitutus sp.]
MITKRDGRFFGQRMAGAALDGLGEAGGGEELIEGVADVFQLGVEFVAVAVKKVRETLERQVGK